MDELESARLTPLPFSEEAATVYKPVGVEAAPTNFTGSELTLLNPSRPIRRQYLELVHVLPTNESEPIYTQMHPTVAVKAKARREKQALAHLQPTLAEVSAAASSYCRLDSIVKAAEARAAAAEAFLQLLQTQSSSASAEVARAPATQRQHSPTHGRLDLLKAD